MQNQLSPEYSLVSTQGDPMIGSLTVDDINARYHALVVALKAVYVVGEIDECRDRARKVMDGNQREAAYLRIDIQGYGDPVAVERAEHALDRVLAMPSDTKAALMPVITFQTLIAAGIGTKNEPRPVSDVYFLQRPDGAVKIGRSINVEKRRNTLQKSAGMTLTILATLPGAGHKTETEYHQRFKHLRMEGEWFSPGQELMDAIAALT